MYSVPWSLLVDCVLVDAQRVDPSLVWRNRRKQHWSSWPPKLVWAHSPICAPDLLAGNVYASFWLEKAHISRCAGKKYSEVQLSKDCKNFWTHRLSSSAAIYLSPIKAAMRGLLRKCCGKTQIKRMESSRSCRRLSSWAYKFGYQAWLIRRRIGRAGLQMGRRSVWLTYKSAAMPANFFSYCMRRALLMWCAYLPLFAIQYSGGQ